MAFSLYTVLNGVDLKSNIGIVIFSVSTRKAKNLRTNFSVSVIFKFIFNILHVYLLHRLEQCIFPFYMTTEY